ncbi:MAG: redoxin domain-containing protein [Chloroflexi bacterium]|nr:redoxin domain-containing protein [Chloroflexota bacterium]
MSTGDRQLNLKLVQQHGIRRPVLLQNGTEVAARYQANGTPMGYLLDEHGTVASELAVGADAVLALVEAPANQLPVVTTATSPASHTNGHAGAFGTRSLANSRLKRDGLAIGTSAPAFRLPRLDGGELALADYRGRRLLLAFSDPHCGPCSELAPQLERVHRQQPELQVVMIGRGDPTANRAKVAEHELSFPIALQERWEISRQYGMFATPIGYLIDEEGIIAADVAVGPAAILALASYLPPPSQPAAGDRRALAAIDQAGGKTDE